MKKFSIIVIGILVVFFLIFFNKSDQYIYMTVTSYKNGKDIDNGMTSSIIYFEPKTGKSNRVFEFETSAQYSLGVFDKKNNRVYYTKRYDGNDQIYSVDLKTKEEKQLTKDFFAVNYIMPKGDRLYFIACEKIRRENQLGFIDLKTGKITYFNRYSDYSVDTFYMENDYIYISAFSSKEERENLIKQTSGDFKIPKSKVLKIDLDFEKAEELVAINWEIKNILKKENLLSIYGLEALYYEKIYDINGNRDYHKETRMNPNFESRKSKKMVFNLDTNKVEKFMDLNRGHISGEGGGYINNDLYLLSYVNGQRGLCKISENGEKKIVFTLPNESNYINNMQIIYK